MALNRDAMNGIAAIQNRYLRELDQIRANKDLSEHGKRKALAREYKETLHTIATMRAAFEEENVRVRGALEKKLFAAASNDGMATIAYRDALDRAAQIKKPSEAQLMLRRAVRHGDDSLARAIFAHAMDKTTEPLGGTGWSAVIQEYTDTVRPDLAPTVTAYDDMLRSDGRLHRAEQAIHTSISKPRELAKNNDVEIDVILRSPVDPQDFAPPQPSPASNFREIGPLAVSD